MTTNVRFLGDTFAEKPFSMKKVLSISLIPSYCGVRFLFFGFTDWAITLAGALICASLILLQRPLRSDKELRSSIAAAALCLSAALLQLLPDPYIAPCICTGAATVYQTLRYLYYLKDLKLLFKNDAPLLFLSEYSRSVILSLLCMAVILLSSGAIWPAIIVSLLLYIISYHCTRTGRIPALGSEKERSLKEIIKGDLRSSPYMSMDSNSRMNALYTRATKYMETEQPFLIEGFSLAAMSEALFTNKSYLSRVINYYSGRNFKQFVNYYRVRYAVELIKKDPHLSVLELATMSGFRSTVTFNVAFRLNMNDSPGSYCRNAAV